METSRNLSEVQTFVYTSHPPTTEATDFLDIQVDSLSSFLTVFLFWLAIVISCTTCFRSLVKSFFCDLPNALCQRFCRSDPNQINSRRSSVQTTNPLRTPTATRFQFNDEVIYITQPMEIRIINDLESLDDLEDDHIRIDNPPDYRIALQMPKPVRYNNDQMRLDLRHGDGASSDRESSDIQDDAEGQPLTSGECTVSCDHQDAVTHHNSNQTEESPPPSYYEVMNI